MTPKQREAIIRHGRQLQAIFPDAKRDPLELCRRLQRIEGEANRYAVRLCCEDVSEETQERTESRLLRRVQDALGDRDGRVWINRDPRGYALKLDLRAGESLHTDWGGYGIVAPEIGPEGA